MSKSLILATGTNLGNKQENLNMAKELLNNSFNLIKESPIYSSAPQGEIQQEDFLNQCLEFELSNLTPQEVLNIIHSIEREMGRVRIEKWGPRIIDIDIIFWDLEEYQSQTLTIPHPWWNKRSFVVKPLSHLPFFKKIKNKYNIPDTFEPEAYELKK